MRHTFTLFSSAKSFLPQTGFPPSFSFPPANASPSQLVFAVSRFPRRRQLVSSTLAAHYYSEGARELLRRVQWRTSVLEDVRFRFGSTENECGESRASRAARGVVASESGLALWRHSLGILYFLLCPV